MNTDLDLKNERSYGAILEHSIDTIAVLSPEGKVLYVTPAIEIVLGYTRDEAINLDLFSLTHPEDKESLSEAWKKMLNTNGEVIHIQTCRLKHKDGTWHWIESSVKNTLNDPAVNGVIYIFRDVTDSAVATNQNVLDQNNLEALINSTTDMIWSMDRNLNLIVGNKPFIDIMHKFVGKEVSKGDNVFSMEIPQQISQELILKYKEYYQRALAGEVISNVDSFVFPQQMWLQFTYHPIRLNDEIIGVACHSRDITEEKKIEQKRIRNEARLKESQALAKLGHWELNLATGEALWSDETCRIYGLSVDDNRHTLEEWLLTRRILTEI